MSGSNHCDAERHGFETTGVTLYDAQTYGRSFADIYDEWYADQDPSPAVDLLFRLGAGPSQVLELGIGTGRLAIALSAAGHSVTGIDPSAEMLERLRAKPGASAIDARLGDATDANTFPPGPFDWVIAAFNLVCNLEDRAAQASCLVAARSVLAAGGRFVVEAFVPNPPPERQRDLITRTVDADHVVLIATDTDPATSTIVGSHIELRDGSIRLRPWRVCYFTPDELDRLADAAGFVLDARWADFDGSEFVASETASHVSVYSAR